VTWVVEDVFGPALLDDPAGVHDGDPVGEAGDDPQVVGDQEKAHVEPSPETDEQFEDLRLDRDVESGCGFIRDQQRGLARQRGREHRTLAHPARELMRVLAHSAHWVGYAYEVEQLDGALLGRGTRGDPVSLEHLGYLASDAKDRVQAGKWILEDETGAAGADGPQLTIGETDEFAPLETHAPADRRRAFVEQTKYSQRADTLARARLPDQTERFAGTDRVREAAHRPQGP
jgi:hypothetical protein